MEVCQRHQISHSAGGYCPACVAAMALAEEEQEGETPIASLGDYELISELGRGGMGVVYLARQTSLNRRVALKLLPSGSLAGNESIQRFRRESELAASLRHPNIVPIFEAGQCEGEMFYSMELILGGSLADWRDGKSQQPRDAAKLLHTLALAVEYAHQHGILHRDLKPANVLIDEDGQPKVADFGLARALDATGDLTLGTRSFGSPAYMAPELIRDPHAATPASDVYSLGAICYFLISGRPPFVSASLEELLRQVRECEPAAPRVLDPSIPRDLQKICLKAVDKSPAKRYPTARELAADLHRFLEGRPVLARPTGRLMKCYRLARRSPWLTAAISTTAISVAVGVAGIAWYAKLAGERAADAARNATDLRLNLYASDLATASVALRRGDSPLADQVLSRWMLPAPGPDLRGFGWKLLKQQSEPAQNRLIEHRDATITDITFSSDGSQLAIADQGGRITVHPAGGSQPSTPLPGSAENVSSIPTKFGGGWVLGDSTGNLRWIDPHGRVLFRENGRHCSLAAALPLAIVSSAPRFHWWVKAGDARVIDWKSGRLVRDIPGEWRHVILSPDGKTAALAGAYGGLKLVDIATGTSRNLPVASNVWALSFSPDGKQLAAGSRRSAIVWDLSSDSSPPHVYPHDLTVWMTAFSHDGSRFLTAASDRRVRVFQTAEPSAPPLTLSGHRSEVWCAAFSPDDSSVTAGGKDGDVLRWEIGDAEPDAPLMIHDSPEPPVFSPDGNLLLARRKNRSILHDLASGTSRQLPAGINGIGFQAGSQNLLVTDSTYRSGHLPIKGSGPPVFNHNVQFAAPVRSLRVVGNGRWLARVLTDGEILLENPTDGTIALRLRGPVPGMRHSVTASDDGRWLAVCGDGSRSVTLHDLIHHARRELAPASSYYFISSAFSRDGEWLAAGDLSGPIQIWNTRTGERIATLSGHPEETSAVAFSPDGKILTSMGFHQDLKLWHTPTWREVHSIDLPDAAHFMQFTPDGSHLFLTRGRLGNEILQSLPAISTGSPPPSEPQPWEN